jgi:hypothetical protein
VMPVPDSSECTSKPSSPVEGLLLLRQIVQAAMPTSPATHPAHRWVSSTTFTPNATNSNGLAESASDDAQARRSSRTPRCPSPPSAAAAACQSGRPHPPVRLASSRSSRCPPATSPDTYSRARACGSARTNRLAVRSCTGQAHIRQGQPSHAQWSHHGELHNCRCSINRQLRSLMA